MAVIGLSLLIGPLASGQSGRKLSGRLWLSSFVGNEVVVVFRSAPPDMDQTVKAQLLHAEYPGVVLKFGNEEIFFSYSNVISIEPAVER